MEQEVGNGNRWSQTPVCSCANGGKPILFNGEMVTFLSPSCRVHITTFTYTNKPQSVERIIGNWDGRDRE